MKKLFIWFGLLLVFFVSMGVNRVYGVDFSKETIYFIVVDRFYDGDKDNNPKGEIFSPDKSQWKLYWGGDLQGIIDKMPYIKKMGFSAIWITPIFDNTESLYLYGKNKEEKMSAYHGYWGRDFYKSNQFFGSKEKFKELIDKAHSMGIKVIFDYVLNHSSPINQGIDGAIYKDGKLISSYSRDKKNWFHHNGSVNFKVNTRHEWQFKNLFDLADFNSENPEVEKYLFDAAKMWMSLGFDAFRLDTVRHVPEDVCARFYESMKKENPDIFIFGEWSMGGLDYSLTLDFIKRTNINIIDFRFTYYLTRALCRNKSFKALARYIENDIKIENPHLMVTCIDNHDMPRFISTAIGCGFNKETARKKTELATYILMTSRGIPCIYYGTEQFLHVDKKSSWGYGGEPYNRQMMKGWDKYNSFCKNIKVLAELRKRAPAISKGVQKTLLVKNNIWVFERRYKKSIVMVAVNKGKERLIKIDNTSLPTDIYKGVMGKEIFVKDGKTKFKLGSNMIGIWCNNF